MAPLAPIIGIVGFVEIHFHLLPGVDDGPRCAQESVSLAAAAVADGTRIVVVTPHVHPEHITDPDEIATHTRELAECLRREHVELAILPGGELDHTMVARLEQSQLEQIAQGPRGGRWLLLEAPFAGLGERFAGAADELRARGFGLVIAHPERAEPTASTRALIDREMHLGSVLQLTAGSFLGVYGREVRRRALGFLHNAPRAVIASDAHGSHRPPALSAALRELAGRGGSQPVHLAEAIPSSLLERGITARPSALVA